MFRRVNIFKIHPAILFINLAIKRGNVACIQETYLALVVLQIVFFLNLIAFAKYFLKKIFSESQIL